MSFMGQIFYLKGVVMTHYAIIDAINREFDSNIQKMHSILNTLKKQLEVLESLNIQERLERLDSFLQKAEQASDLVEKLKVREELSQEENFILHKVAEVGLVEMPRYDCKLPQSDAVGEQMGEQIKKVKKRVPTWIHKYFAGLNPCNGTILVRFLELSEENTRPIKRYELENACKDVSNFTTNYHNMRNMLPSNHGKVFEESYGDITLWESVAEFVLDVYRKTKI